MQATAELQIIPIGDGTSVRQQVTQAVQLLQSYGFIVETHASGTNIEGNIKDILQAVEDVHKKLHEQGSIRLLSYLKLETRTDKISTLKEKKISI